MIVVDVTFAASDPKLTAPGCAGTCWRKENGLHLHQRATRKKTLLRQGAGSAKSRKGADWRGYNRSIALPVALMSDIAQKRMICSIDAFGDAGIVSRSKTRVCWVISLRASELHSILSTWAAKPSSNIDEAGVSPCKNRSRRAQRL